MARKRQQAPKRRALILSVLFALAAGAHAQEVRQRFDIPAQRADMALLEFARQSGTQIFFPYDFARTRSTQALHGEFTPEDALVQLANAGGLAVKTATGKVITLVPMAELAAERRPDDAASSEPGSMPSPAARSFVLQEVIVTATRIAETLNSVPLAITAQTQRDLDERGVRTVADLQDIVPTFQISQLTPSLAHVSIRGIANTGAGAATTGFYLDDTPLTKRNAAGVATASGNGTPLPPLYDLERVEVLRGPQGTLYGGSSQGGTVRYITPLPSLTAYNGNSRLEVLMTGNGDPSYEAGAAIGGPLIENRLAFRASMFSRHSGGFIDIVDRYSGQVREEDANTGDVGMFRGSLLWAPVDQFRATLAAYYSQEQWRTAVSDYSPSMNQPIVEPTLCFNTSGITPATPVNNPVPVACGSPGVTFVRPGGTYGPYPDLGTEKSLLPSLYPSSTDIGVLSLTLDYDFPGFSLKSITSYLADDTEMSRVDSSSQVRDRFPEATYGAVYIPRGLSIWGGLPEELTGGRFLADNARHVITQEVRLASTGGSRPLSWVAGAFYSNAQNRQRYDNIYVDLDRLARGLYGISAEQRYGVPAYLVDGAPVGFDHKDQTLDDVEYAVFGEVNWWLSERLKLIAGLRLSRVEFDYTENHWGPAAGFNVPTVANGGSNAGSVSESPLAPKFGLEYDFSSTNLVYATATKGFRAGGVNTSLPETICGPALEVYGLRATDIPPTYAADTVWSYELGGKFRILDDRMQINAAAFRIDWEDAQINVNPGFGCNIPFVANAAQARSTGLEIEAQAQLGWHLSASAALSLLDVKYTEDAVTLERPGFSPLITAFEGQKLPTPPVTLQVGLRSDFQLGPLDAFTRVDWRYTAGYEDTAVQVFGLSTYAPDNVVPDTSRVNVRVGVTRGEVDLILFANNVLNERDGVSAGGRLGCRLPSAGGTEACSTYAAYNPFFQVAAIWPRQVGFRVDYRFD